LATFLPLPASSSNLRGEYVKLDAATSGIPIVDSHLRGVFLFAQSLCQIEADARIRTADPFITSEVLYQLSYVGGRANCSRFPVALSRWRGRSTR
jgi:hypothetical protein